MRNKALCAVLCVLSFGAAYAAVGQLGDIISPAHAAELDAGPDGVAVDGIPPAPEIVDTIRDVVTATKDGDWTVAALLLIVLLTGLARKYGGKYFPVLKTKVGAVTLVLAGSTAAALAAAPQIGPGAAWAALQLAVTAAGGYTLVKVYGDAALRFAERRGWGWASVAIKFVISLAFPGEKELAAARTAGDKAVADKPATGITMGNLP